jgi:hypothetical protein
MAVDNRPSELSQQLDKEVAEGGWIGGGQNNPE